MDHNTIVTTCSGGRETKEAEGYGRGAKESARNRKTDAVGSRAEEGNVWSS